MYITPSRSTLSLFVFAIGLTIDVHASFPLHHVAIFAKLFDGSPDLEGSDGLNHRCRRRRHKQHTRYRGLKTTSIG
jgi:hypothetical protein